MKSTIRFSSHTFFEIKEKPKTGTYERATRKFENGGISPYGGGVGGVGLRILLGDFKTP